MSDARKRRRAVGRIRRSSQLIARYIMIPISDPSATISSGYLLIDTLNLPPSMECKPLPILPCVPADLTNIADLLPGLVDVTALEDDQLQTVREILALQVAGSHPWAVCAILTCESSIEELSEHIGCFLSVIDDSNRPVLWRFFDPRVFSLSMAIFTGEQRRGLLGPIREWQLAWRRHWWSVTSNSERTGRRPDLDAVTPNKQQWQMLRLSRLIDSVLLQLEQESPFTTSDCVRAQQAAIVYLNDASLELKLSESEDLIDFAYLALKYGRAFTEHPKLKHAKADLIAGRLGWFAFRNSLDAADFRTFEKLQLR